MTEYSYPWTAIDSDRTVAAATAAAYHDALASGASLVLSGLTPTKDGSTVQVAAGVAVVEGQVYVSDAVETLTPAAGTRKDYIVLRTTFADRAIALAVLQGTTEAFPTLTQNGTTWEMAVASVDNSEGSFTVADTRADFTLCGIHDTDWSKSTSNITPEAGWEVQTGNFRRIGQIVSVYTTFKRTGADITVPANGDISNIVIGTVREPFRPGSLQVLTSSLAGRTASGVITENGEITLAAVAPGGNILTNQQISLSGTTLA